MIMRVDVSWYTLGGGATLQHKNQLISLVIGPCFFFIYGDKKDEILSQLSTDTVSASESHIGSQIISHCSKPIAKNGQRSMIPTTSQHEYLVT